MKNILEMQKTFMANQTIRRNRK